MYYFCIFCYDLFDVKHEAKSHFLDHMCNSYYCQNCDCRTKTCTESHPPEASVLSGREQDSINNWSDRFLTLQENYKKSQKIGKLEDCCPVCDCLRLITNGESGSKESLTQSLRHQMCNLERMSESKDVSKVARHILLHLRYYPFECKECPKSPRKTDFGAMLEHVKIEHGAIKNELEAALKLNLFKIGKLDSFVKSYIFQRLNKQWRCKSEEFEEVNNKMRDFVDSIQVSTPHGDIRHKTYRPHDPSPPPPPPWQAPAAGDCSSEKAPTNDESEVSEQAQSSSTDESLSDVTLMLDEDCPSEAHPPLKPCSVIAKRMSDEEVRKYKEAGRFVTCSDSDTDLECSSPHDENSKDVKQVVTIDLTRYQCKPPKDVVPQTQRYFCFMDLNSCGSFQEALNHYYQKLDYYPYECYNCCEVGLTPEDIIEHHMRSHTDDNVVRYSKNVDKYKEKWVLKILSALDDHERPKLRRCHLHCPVCNYYVTHWNVIHDVVTDIDQNHIFKHLKYFPYECIICCSNDKEYAVSAVNKKARQHLYKLHGITVQDRNAIESFFKKSGGIRTLENFIEEYVRNSVNIYGTGDNFSRKRPLSAAQEDFYDELDQLIEEKLLDKLFPCLFCERTCTTLQHAHEHYSDHMNYFPLLCNLCEQKFTTRRAFLRHGRVHSDKEELIQIPVADPIVQKWIERFLCFSNAEREYDPKFSYKCLLCKKIRLRTKDESATKYSEEQIADEVLIQHIYNHLKYRPYQCLVCKERGKESYVTALDYEAQVHLISDGVQTSCPKQKFDKAGEQHRLERLVCKTYRIASDEFRNGFKLSENGYDTMKVEEKKVVKQTDANDSMNRQEVSEVECIHCKQRLPKKQFKRHFKTDHPGMPIFIPSTPKTET